MGVLAERDGRTYNAVTICRASGFVSPFRDFAFPCLIWDHDGRFTDAERAVVAGALLDAGCRYAVCGGQACERWHNAVDWEFVTRHLDAVAFFFVRNTNFNDHDFKRYLVLHVGTGPATEQVDAAVRKYALS